MYRLLIVDDEHHIVNWLADLFEDDPVYEFEISKAYSGKEALAVLQKNRMDLILLDIQMPRLDGLTLAKQILSDWPSCYIIFLTGYNNFDYIYTAIKLEHISYLLKSEDDDCIIGKVHETIKTIESEKQNAQFRMQIHNDTLLLKHLFQKDILKEVIFGKNVLHLKHSVKKLHMNLTIDIEAPVFLSYMKVNWIQAIDSASDYSNVLVQLLNLMDGLIQNRYHYAMIDMNRSVLLWLFQPISSENVALTASFNYLKNTLDDMVVQCQEQFHYSVISVLYSSDITWSQLHDTYIGMQEYDTYKLPHIISGNYLSTVLNTSDLIESYSDSKTLYESNMILSNSVSKLHNQLYQGNSAAFIENLKNISYIYASEKSMHNLHALKTYLNISALFLGYINQYHLQEKLSLKISLYNLYYISDFASWKDAYQYLLQLARIIFDEIHSQEKDRKYELIAYFKKYIKNHLAENLSLSMISENFNYNSSYISHIFKQITGIGISEYITMARIEEANTLLLTTNDSIAVIANATGFDTAQYFSYVYKKRTGISPTDFRINNKKV
jgi:Response regulator containing CheY-like receiver domain and AraC-type DNA-binding domain